MRYFCSCSIRFLPLLFPVMLSAALLASLVLGYLFWNRYRLRQKVLLDAAVIREQQLGLNNTPGVKQSPVWVRK